MTTKTKTKKPKRDAQFNCDCLEQIQAQLKERGVAITQELQINFTTGRGYMSVPSLRAHKLDSADRKAKVPVILCAHCPICGKKYGEQK